MDPNAHASANFSLSDDNVILGKEEKIVPSSGFRAGDESTVMDPALFETRNDKGEEESICFSDYGECYLLDEDDEDEDVDDEEVDDYDRDAPGENGEVESILVPVFAPASTDDETFDLSDGESQSDDNTFDCGSTIMSEYAVVTSVASKFASTTATEQSMAAASSAEATTAFEILWNGGSVPLPNMDAVDTSRGDDLSPRDLTPSSSTKDETPTVASTPPSKEELALSERQAFYRSYLAVPSLTRQWSTNLFGAGSSRKEATTEELEEEEDSRATAASRKERALAALGKLQLSVNKGFAAVDGAYLSLFIRKPTSSTEDSHDEDGEESSDVEKDNGKEEDLESFSNVDPGTSSPEVTASTKKRSAVLGAVASTLLVRYRRSFAVQHGNTGRDTQEAIGTEVPSGHALDDGEYTVDYINNDNITIDDSNKEITSNARHWLWMVIIIAIAVCVIVVFSILIYAFAA